MSELLRKEIEIIPPLITDCVHAYVNTSSKNQSQSTPHQNHVFGMILHNRHPTIHRQNLGMVEGVSP